jgi:hypothetical protein
VVDRAEASRISHGEVDWDRYEWRLILNAERWAAAHPADPGAEVVRERARVARERMTMAGGVRRSASRSFCSARIDPRAARSRIA